MSERGRKRKEEKVGEGDSGGRRGGQASKREAGNGPEDACGQRACVFPCTGIMW